MMRPVTWQPLVRRPLLRVLRAAAHRRLGRLEPDVATVVTVNWESLPYLEVLVRSVRRRSPPGTRIVVVDNGSRDGSRKRLRELRVGCVPLPLNVGHELALDIGFLLARTEYVVALDVDAFPIVDDWLEQLLDPLARGCEVSGARLNRRYVHPCCLAMRTRRFVEQRHTFESDYSDGRGDVGESISEREAGRLHFFDLTSQRGPQAVGSVFGNLVYHNFYTTRFRATERDVLDKQVTPDDPVQAWAEALARFAP